MMMIPISGSGDGAAGKPQKKLCPIKLEYTRVMDECRSETYCANIWV